MDKTKSFYLLNIGSIPIPPATNTLRALICDNWNKVKYIYQAHS